MATYTGLLQRLKDRQTCVPDKLKLAKFAWVTDSVPIPNKQQQILDFISGLLVNKKKHNLKKEDVVSIWTALNKFLHISGPSAIVKSSILQAVTEDLSSFLLDDKPTKSKSFKDPEDVTYMLQVIGCTQQLVALQSVTTSQFESLCVLLSTVCLLLTEQNVKLRSCETELRQLIESVITVLNANLRVHLNQTQAMHTVTDKVLPVALKMLDTVPCESLESFLLNSLLHRDHQEQYATYIKHVFNEPGQAHIKQAPKSIANIFTVLDSHITQSGLSAMARFLPGLMKTFAHHNSSAPKLCFLFLKHLVKLVTREGIKQKVSSEDVWVRVVADCVSACEDCDIFSADTGNNNDVLKWFFQLTEVVLDKNRSSSWFDFMRSVLRLNHLIVEKFWGRIFALGLFNANQVPEESYNARDNFLSELVTIYLKLRRSPDLLAALISSVEMADSDVDAASWTHSPKFVQKLCCMFSEAPVASVLGMWEMIQEAAVRAVNGHRKASQGSDLSWFCLLWMMKLYTGLIDNARLLDHRTAGPHNQRINLLMQQLEEEVLNPLQKIKEVEKQCPSFGELLSTWMTLKTLWCPRWRSSGLNDAAGEMQMENIEKLVKRLDTASKAKLACQRRSLASATQVEVEGMTKERGASSDKHVMKLLEFPPLTKEDVFKAWTRDTLAGHNVTEVKCQHFQQFTQLFPLVAGHLHDSTIVRCCDLVIEILSLVTLRDLEITPRHSLLTVVMEFINHPGIREVKRLVELLVTTIWRALLDGLTGTSCSPRRKKMRKSDAENELPSALSRVTNYVTSNSPVPSELAFQLSAIDGEFDCQPHFLVLIHVLRQLDLDYLPNLNLKCLIGGMVLLACTKGTKSCDDLKQGVVQLLTERLSVPNISALWERVEASDVLEFVIKYSSQLEHSQLVTVTVQAIMNDHRAVISMSPVVKELVTDLQTDQAGQMVKMKVVALMIRYCHKYITKVYHVQEVREAALQIFFTLAKFVIKHSLDWFEKTTLASQPVSHTSTVDVVQDHQPGKKQKRKSKQHDGYSEVKKMDLATLKGDEAWCCVLECVSEVLQLWSKDAADEKFNQHVVSTVKQVISHVLKNLKEDGASSKVRETELQFIEACCHCHLRCCSQSSSSLSSKDDCQPRVAIIKRVHKPRSSSTPSSSSSSSSSSLSSGKFCLLKPDKLEELWTVCFSLGVSGLSFLPKTSEVSRNSGSACKMTKTGGCNPNLPLPSMLNSKENLSLNFEKQYESQSFKDSDMIAKSPTKIRNEMPQERSEDHKKSGQNSLNRTQELPDKIESWPNIPKASVDVLTAILECCTQERFRHFLEEMMGKLVLTNTLELPSVYIVVALWRHLITSNLIPETHVRELFGYMYQMLSSVLSVLQYCENMEAVSTSVDGMKSTEGRSPMHAASRFVIHALSDFVDLGKTLITPRMTLLCLHAGSAFTLTCPSDLEALYGLVNTLLVHHTNTALKAVPTVLTVVNKLVSACVELSSEERLAQHTQDVQDLVHCAQLITRLLTLLSSPTYKTDLAKVAHTVLAEYVTGVQRCPPHTAVKKELVRGLYKLMSVCDKFRLAALNAALPAGVKDIFKFLHQDYEKYHRYSGLV